MTGTTQDVGDLVRAVVRSHRNERGPLLVILQEIQHRLGYLDPQVVPLVAAELNLSRADVHGVATFYRDFRSEPAGHVTVRLCRAEACQSVGAEELLTQVEDRLGVKMGQTSGDRSVTLEHVFCLGNCALGPSAQINGRVYGRLDSDAIAAAVRTELL